METQDCRERKLVAEIGKERIAREREREREGDNGERTSTKEA